MQKGLIITCPSHDDATAYLTYYSQQILEEAQKRGIKVKQIKDASLNQVDFSAILQKLDYKLLVLNAHGAPYAIFGPRNNLLIELGKNEDLLRERITYARSCSAGERLGKEAMRGTQNGCFIGYELPFIFYMDARWTTKPNNDKIARIFLEPSNGISLSIIKGQKAIDAHIHAKNQTLKMMSKLMRGRQERETPFYLEALWNNYIGQVIHGNEKVTL